MKPDCGRFEKYWSATDHGGRALTELMSFLEGKSLEPLLALATEMLGNSEEKASLWLQKSRKIFGGHSAIEHAKTEIGAREVEKVIGRIRHGVAV